MLITCLAARPLVDSPERNSLSRPSTGQDAEPGPLREPGNRSGKIGLTHLRKEEPAYSDSLPASCQGRVAVGEGVLPVLQMQARDGIRDSEDARVLGDHGDCVVLELSFPTQGPWK
ncbi:uncharacterized protein ATNIH1004_008021 [Aspergillus tanneri]|uniref:Uncharacterized protein n=1 Tax=Aspergillus tanneri TaxID=1220188 RepID=A0A5M9MHZ2_9EURO|nr:uncharacterized protein ATNIH1004_008021 [Aspergillus tanneri]KAA8646588.1 hypothetical protein ATNIH1004_008021 [Aspergillus tanneri]